MLRASLGCYEDDDRFLFACPDVIPNSISGPKNTPATGYRPVETMEVGVCDSRNGVHWSLEDLLKAEDLRTSKGLGYQARASYSSRSGIIRVRVVRVSKITTSSQIKHSKVKAKGY